MRRKNKPPKSRPADREFLTATNGIGTSVRERLFLLRLSLYKALVYLMLGIGASWALLRVGTFFLLPSVGNHLQQTVNVSPWWIVLGIQGLCLVIVVIVFFAHSVLEMHGALIWIVPGVVVAGSILFESIILLAIPDASLAAWAFHANTTSSIRSYERQVKATPYTVQYRRMRVRNAQIENWQCGSPIKIHMSFQPEFAGHPLCVTVHEGYFGWEWIENLRVCSETDLQRAVPISPCEVWAPGMGGSGFPKTRTEVPRVP